MKKYILGAMLSLGIIISPAYAYAAGLTDSQVQAILSLLSSFGADQSVINNVQQSLTGGAPTTGSSFCYSFNNDLTVGNSGADVTALNKALATSGIDTTGNSSVFDENSAGDVVAFQSKYGIRQTGFVGPMTRAKLNSLYECENQQSTTTAPSATIDQNSLSATTARPTITGSASGVSVVALMAVDNSGYGYLGGPAQVTDGRWSVTMPVMPAGTYPVTLSDNSTGKAIAKGTLTVNSSTQTGTLSVTRGPGDPVSSNVVAGSNHVLVGQFAFSAQNDSYTIRNLAVLVPAGAMSSIASVAVSYQDKNGAMQTASQSPATGSSGGNAKAVFTGLTLYVPSNGSANLNVYVSTVTVASGAAPGAAISIGLDTSANTFRAVNSSGTALTQINSGAAIAGGGTFYVYKSTPVVALDAMQSPGGLTQGASVLMRFSVTADPAGSVGLAYLTPTVVASGVQFSSVSAYAYIDAGYFQPIAGASQGNVGTVNPSGGLTGTFTIPVTNGSQPIVIPAGQTYYFQITGVISSITGNGSVTTSLGGDTTYVPVGSYNNNLTRFNGSTNFIWSPNDSRLSSFADNDWTNGYLVQNLSAHGVSQTRTGSGTTSSVVSVAPTATVSDAQVRNAKRSADIVNLSHVIEGEPLLPSNGYACISSSCYGQWKVYSANPAIDAIITAVMQKPSDPTDPTRGMGGYLYDDPTAWGNEPGFPRGYYLEWEAETVSDTATACSPGKFLRYETSSITCGLKIGDEPASTALNTTSSQTASVLNAFGSAATAIAAGSQSNFNYAWGRDLQIGSPYSADVTALQTALTKEGTYTGNITGGFYSQTFAAVKAFQQKYGIDATGFVGPATRAKLDALY